MTTLSEKTATDAVECVISYRSCDLRQAKRIRRLLHRRRIPDRDASGAVSYRWCGRRLSVAFDKTALIAGSDLDAAIDKLLADKEYLFLVCSPAMVDEGSSTSPNWGKQEYLHWKSREHRGEVAAGSIYLLWIEGQWSSPGDDPHAAKPSWLLEPEASAMAFDCRTRAERSKTGICLPARVGGFGPADQERVIRHELRHRVRVLGAALLVLLAVSILIAWLAWSKSRLASDLDRRLHESHRFTSDVLATHLVKMQSLHGSQDATMTLLGQVEAHLRSLDAATRSESLLDRIRDDRDLCRLLIAAIKLENGDHADCLDGCATLLAEVDARVSDGRADTASLLTRIQALSISAAAQTALLHFDEARATLSQAIASVDDALDSSKDSTVVLRARLRVQEADLDTGGDVDLDGYKSALSILQAIDREFMRLPELEQWSDPHFVICPVAAHLLAAVHRRIAEAELRFAYWDDSPAAFERAVTSCSHAAEVLGRLVSAAASDRIVLTELIRTITTLANLHETRAITLLECSVPPEQEATRQRSARDALELGLKIAVEATEAARTLVLLNPRAQAFVSLHVNALLVQGRIRGVLRDLDGARACFEAAIDGADRAAKETSLGPLQGARSNARRQLAHVLMDTAARSAPEARRSLLSEARASLLAARDALMNSPIKPDGRAIEDLEQTIAEDLAKVDALLQAK